MTTFIALLRGINVTGNNKIRMADLRSLCEKLGWRSVSTYIQSGNVVFEAEGAGSFLEAALEDVIKKKLKLEIPVVVRSARMWRAYVTKNPFGEASLSRPNLVHLALCKKRPDKGAAKALNERAQNDERVIATGDALWIDYASSVGRSKLTPALLDRLVGSSVTARNWRTVLKLETML